jgi:hypothetical protein
VDCQVVMWTLGPDYYRIQPCVKSDEALGINMLRILYRRLGYLGYRKDV